MLKIEFQGTFLQEVPEIYEESAYEFQENNLLNVVLINLIKQTLFNSIPDHYALLRK